MTNQWNFRTLTPDEQANSEQLARELGISHVLTKLLVIRGIKTFEEAKQFFRPDLSQLHDPFLMNDMDKAVERLNLALGRKEKILVYGDYDVDGTTAVALVYKYLQQFTSNLDYYLPDRYTEGYGISYKGIDYAAANGFSLVIALDCGIKAVDKIAYANEHNVDFIICDHHMPDEILPNAVAVLDPKRLDSTYPYPHLSGCGVGFKLMQALAINNQIDLSSAYQLIDFLAVSIASDIVPITGENRVLAHFGLKKLSTNPNLGLRSIINLCALNEKEISISDIVFKIGPRINASGRIQSAREAVDLLVTRDETFANTKCDCLNQYNETRKDLDKSITEEASQFLLNLEGFRDKKSIVVYHPSWHKGVVGIVASRLTELYYRPSIVLTLSNGLVTGSARSVPGYDIYKAIENCRDLLENFGGHMYAAGLTLKESNLEAFKHRFETFVCETITDEQLQMQLDIDCVIDFNEITPKFFRILKQFSPYGPENMKPIFCTRRVFDYGTSRLVGKDQEHIKMELVDASSENVMNGIAFRMGEFNDYLKAMNPLDICYTLEENNFNGNSSIQLLIKDIKIADSND
ncbi:single-stranded-DNA-specific exonuclease RecJ [Microbacter margulisiae]|uniref:Single-stranded-DNA-specific exonuclease RecJ n=1 Tax=Microbacter margulisiae TaxID=1350067 RepID=A0A7W5DSD0_9PORP|nr:single-stranded-DNA-specific exonuclease RecJ [Microbacter margulisiae]MBB3188186.1 single-stranded-DNA-specific exonuclease [Microbacter margulisiae]